MTKKTRAADRRIDEQVGLAAQFASETLPRARQVELQWRWPTTLVLLCTVPSFYVELVEPSPLAVASYLLAAAVMAASLLHVGWHSGNLQAHLRANRFDILLCIGLVVAALLPPSATSTPSLYLRLVVGFFTMSRMFWAAHYVVTRGSMLYRLVAVLLVLLLCGLGFWWLEPTTPTYGDALWLAFTTAATVGYGDSVPTTSASRIFAVFVVFLGVGAITLVAAAIASAWIATEERHIEREVLDDLHKQLGAVRAELAALREALLTRATGTTGGEPTGAVPPQDRDGP
jgi:voltage-gated potassium channel